MNPFNIDFNKNITRTKLIRGASLTNRVLHVANVPLEQRVERPAHILRPQSVVDIAVAAIVSEE